MIVTAHPSFELNSVKGYFVAISDGKPVSPNEHEYHATYGHGLNNGLSKVKTDGNRVNVHEDLIFTETTTKTII